MITGPIPLVVAAVLPPLVLLSGMAMTPALVLLVLLLLLHRRRGLSPFTLPGAKFTAAVLALVLVWPACTIAWSITPGPSLTMYAKTLAIMLIGAWGFLLARGERVAPSAAAWLAGGIVFSCALVMLEQLPQHGLIGLGYDLFAANYDKYIHKNVNRGLCALTVFVWPAMLLLERAQRPRLAAALPIVLALPVAVMHSLSAKMALIVAIPLYLLLRWRPLTAARVAVMVIPAVIVLWPIGFNVFYRSVFTAPTVYARLPDSSQARVDIWHFVSERIAERPVLGWGFETARAIPGGNDVQPNGRTLLPLHPHNSAFHVLLEQGVIGLVLTMTALVLVLHAWRTRLAADPSAAAAAGAAIVAYLVVGFSAFGLWQTWWLASAWIAAILFELGATAPTPRA